VLQLPRLDAVEAPPVAVHGLREPDEFLEEAMSVEKCAECGEIIPTDGSFRVTLRREGLELRGLIGNYETLRMLADAVKPMGVMVYASPSEPHAGCHE